MQHLMNNNKRRRRTWMYENENIDLEQNPLYLQVPVRVYSRPNSINHWVRTHNVYEYTFSKEKSYIPNTTQTVDTSNNLTRQKININRPPQVIYATKTLINSNFSNPPQNRNIILTPNQHIQTKPMKNISLT